MMLKIAILGAFTHLTHQHEKKARLVLGRQLTFLQGEDPAYLWHGDKAEAANAEKWHDKLRPLLHELYGKEAYEFHLSVIIKHRKVSVDLAYEGLFRPFSTPMTFEWVTGQKADEASISLKAWSMASLRFLGAEAALNIVSYTYIGENRILIRRIESDFGDMSLACAQRYDWWPGPQFIPHRPRGTFDRVRRTSDQSLGTSLP